MHYQGPPSASAKVVTCLLGQVADFVLDIRRSSPTFGRSEGFELSGDISDSILIPAGVAHGSYVGKGPAILTYLTDTRDSPLLIDLTSVGALHE